MGGTPEWLKQRIRDYYQTTNERSYLPNWSGEALSYHYGLADETTASLDEAHRNANRYVADRLGIGPGVRALDAGCGVGGTSIWMAKERGAEMTGITLDPTQIALGERFAAERGARVRFHVMDYMATDLPERSFDAVFNVESLCHCADLDVYFAHVRSLLGDGGRYGCLEFFRGEGHPERVKEVMDTWAMPCWASMAEVETALSGAGFEDVEAVDLTPAVALSARQMLAMAKNTQLVAKLDAAVTGKPGEPVLDGHVRGAIACSLGLLEGGVTYGFVRGNRPRRREGPC
jgi:cyclopropane fatty-acyl-phospholipid synthase-like methyltransferase